MTDAPVQLPPALQKPKLRRADASRYLALVHGIDLAPATLAKWATIPPKGGGPAYHLSGRFPLYPVTELDAWAEKRLGKLRTNSSGAA